MDNNVKEALILRPLSLSLPPTAINFHFRTILEEHLSPPTEFFTTSQQLLYMYQVESSKVQQEVDAGWLVGTVHSSQPLRSTTYLTLSLSLLGVSNLTSSMLIFDLAIPNSSSSSCHHWQRYTKLDTS